MNIWNKFLNAISSIFQKKPALKQESKEEILAKDIMEDRSTVEFISMNNSLNEVASAFKNSQEYYLPIIGSTIDDVKGAICIKSLVDVMQNSSKNLFEKIENVCFIHERSGLNNVFVLLCARNFPLVIVVDSFGSTQGIITKRIIIDTLYRFSMDEESMPKNLVGTIFLSGLTPVEYLWFLDFIDFEKYESKTIGGFLMEYLCKSDIPKEGYQFLLGNYDIKIIEADDRQINKVSIRPIGM